MARWESSASCTAITCWLFVDLAAPAAVFERLSYTRLLMIVPLVFVVLLLIRHDVA